MLSTGIHKQNQKLCDTTNKKESLTRLTRFNSFDKDNNHRE